MKTVVVGLYNQSVKQQMLLPSTFVSDGVKFVVHNSPRVTYNNYSVQQKSGYTINCDILFDSHIEKHTNISVEALFSSVDIPRFTSWRYSKFKQGIIVNNLIRKVTKNKGNCRLISIPTLAGMTGTESFNDENRIHYGLIDYPTDVVIRSDYGARQLCIVFANVHNENSPHGYISLHELLSDLCKYSKSEMKGKYGNAITFSVEDRQGSDTEGLLPSELVVTPFIHNVAHEYRMLKFGDEILVFGRDVMSLGNNYTQCDDSTRFQRLKPIKVTRELDGTVILDDKSEWFPKELFEVIFELPIEYGSIDVIRTEQGGCGIVEFSTDFDYSDHSISVIRKAMMKFVADKSALYLGLNRQ